MAKSKRVKVTISGRGYKEVWKIEQSDDGTITTAATKAKAMTLGRRICKRLEKHGIPSSLIVKNRKGRIQFERSYPRSYDPRPKPGSDRNRGIKRRAKA